MDSQTPQNIVDSIAESIKDTGTTTTENIIESIGESISEVMPKKLTPVLLFSLVTAFLVGLFIFVLNHKYTYEISNNLLKNAFGESWDKKTKCPTSRGLWIHSFIGGILVFFFIFISRKPLIKLMKKHLNI